MLNTIKCKNCGQEIEVDKALEGQIEARVLASEHKKHELELEKVRIEALASAKKTADAALELARKEAADDLEIAKKRLESNMISDQKKAALEHSMLIKSLQDDAQSKEESNAKLREQLSGLMKSLREEKEARLNADLQAQKKVAAESDKIRELAAKSADEKYHLKIAELEKKQTDTQKALEEAQRKASQGSQQLQGEILELDLEEALINEFRDDEILPVDKGVRGADIKQKVKSPGGIVCGEILWETKRTKNWTEGWVQKLKDDLRATKANIPVIVSEVLPKDSQAGIIFHNGIYVAKPSSAIILAGLLRKSLLDVGRERTIAKHRDTGADALYGFVTSHEFVQQIEAMAEVYTDMITDIVKEKAVYERIWAKRDAQAKKLFGSTANIIGSIHGQIGSGSMPKIKGLEIDLLSAGDEV